ncbi:hypothetical protein Efla_004036 [Eimeria flavescens]
MELTNHELDISQLSTGTTHIGGQDASTPQIVIVDADTLACVCNTHLLLYQVVAGSRTSNSNTEGGNLLQSHEEVRLAHPLLLHPPNGEGYTPDGDRGISAVAVDRDHQLIAVCGRTVGKPANIYIYSLRNFQLVTCCKALGERGFSAAAFRGKFTRGGELGVARNADSKPTSASPKPSSSSVGALIPVNDPLFLVSEEVEKVGGDKGNNVGPSELASVDDGKDQNAGVTIAAEHLYNPDQVPLLAAIGWEGDAGEAASVDSSYLTLWNVSEGAAFLRLRTPALQVMSLQWSPFDAYQLTASGSRHVRVWTAVRTFTGLKLKGHTCRFGHLTVSDVRCFAELTQQLLISGSDWGSLLIWEDGSIKAELLELVAGTAGLCRKRSTVARDQPADASLQRGPAGGLRLRTNPRGSMRAGRKGSSQVQQGVDDFADRVDGIRVAPDFSQQQLKPCHQATVSSVFRDPSDECKIVSAGADGRIKWWSARAVVEAIRNMGEEPRIALPALDEFSMPDGVPIKSVLPNRDTGDTFWLVADERGATWLFWPLSKNMVKVFDFHVKGILAAIEAPQSKQDRHANAARNVTTIGRDGSVRIWGPPPCQMPVHLRRWGCQVTSMALLPTLEPLASTLVLLAFDNGVLRLLRLLEDRTQLLLAIKTHECSIAHLAVDPSGERLAVLGEDGLLLFLKVERRSQIKHAESEEQRKACASTSTANWSTTGEKADSPVSDSTQPAWHAKPLGYTRSPKPLSRLIWEIPLLLFGIATDAALLVVNGLQNLGHSGNQASGDSCASTNAEENHNSEKNEDVCVGSSSGQNGVTGRRNMESRLAQKEAGSLQFEDRASDETQPKNCLQLHSSEDLGFTSDDPLDLTAILSLTRVAIKVSSAALRAVYPDEKKTKEEAGLSACDSDSEGASDSEAAAATVPKSQEDGGTASRGSVADQAVTAVESKRVLEAATKQQRRLRAAASVAGPSARLTAVTSTMLATSANTPDALTWRINCSCASLSTGTSGKTMGMCSGRPFVLFSGTANLRNAIWCAPLEPLLGLKSQNPPPVTPAVVIAARPLVSLSKALQQLCPKTSGNLACCEGPHITQLSVIYEDGVLAAGTSDGRVLLLPVDMPKACAVTRVFDCQTGLVSSIFPTHLDSPSSWALVAGSQSGAWWRCEVDFASLRRRCEKASKQHRKQDIGGASPDAFTANQQLIRNGPAQQQAEKQQQQQKFLRRLLAQEIPAADEDCCGNGQHYGRMKKALNAPCPDPVYCDDLLQPKTRPFLEADRRTHLGHYDCTEDLLNPSEPTIIEHRKRRQKQEAEAEGNAIMQQERLRLHHMTLRYKARSFTSRRLGGATTLDQQRKLILHAKLLKADEEKSAQELEAVENAMQEARTQQHALISNILHQFEGSVDDFEVAGIFANLSVFGLPEGQGVMDLDLSETVTDDYTNVKAYADLQRVFDATRIKELRRLLIPEQARKNCAATTSRRPTVEAESKSSRTVKSAEALTEIFGPESLAAFSLLNRGLTSWPENRQKRLEEIAALLKAQPPENFTDPQDEARIAQTVESLDAYRLIPSSRVAGETLNLGCFKRRQIRELADWASEKAQSFNCRLNMLSKCRSELLKVSHCLICGALEAFRVVGLENCPDNSGLTALAQTVRTALFKGQNQGRLWKVDKQTLVRFLEQRQEHLRTAGALFQSDSDKSEAAEVDAVLNEARLLPDDFFTSFEHLRQPLVDMGGDGHIAAHKTVHGATPPGAEFGTTNVPSSRAKHSEEMICARLSEVLDRLTRTKGRQSGIIGRTVASREAAQKYFSNFAEENSTDPAFHLASAWAARQSLEVKLHGAEVLRTIIEALNVFDDELRNLFIARAEIQEQLLLGKLKQLEQYEELLVINSMEQRSLRLQQDLSCEQRECHRIENCIATLDGAMQDVLQAIDNCHATEAKIRQRLQEAIGPRHPQHASLLQIFERKVYIPKLCVAPELDGIDEAELPQQEAEDLEVDVCPLGCDMALYEALLELRDQKTENALELARRQRELDELRKDYRKACSLHRQHQSRYKSAESAIHKFMNELQERLNELVAVVPLKASQIRCLSLENGVWKLPPCLNSTVMFSHKGFAALSQQVSQLRQEASTVAEELRHLKRTFAIAKKDHAQSFRRLASLRATFKDVELVRFGRSLTLKQVEAAAMVAGRADKQAASQPVKPAFERDLEAVVSKQAQVNEQKRDYDELRRLLQDMTKRHTILLCSFSCCRGDDLLLSRHLQNKQFYRVGGCIRLMRESKERLSGVGPMKEQLFFLCYQAATPCPQSLSSAEAGCTGSICTRRREEFLLLKEQLERGQRELLRLQALLQRLQRKGQHIEPAALCSRDQLGSQPSNS